MRVSDRVGAKSRIQAACCASTAGYASCDACLSAANLLSRFDERSVWAGYGPRGMRQIRTQNTRMAFNRAGIAVSNFSWRSGLCGRQFMFFIRRQLGLAASSICLLYTSDAADDM
eukprot:6171268-Prymnesium_polylepis.1